MKSVQFDLPQLTCDVLFHVKQGESVKGEQERKKYFAVAGGRGPEKNWLKDAVTLYDSNVYCADNGAQYALEAGVLPQVIYGDADSADTDIYAKAKEMGAAVHTYNPAKDDTDLQLLLNNLPAGDLLISGVWGGRFDHLYSNVFSILGYKLRDESADSQVILADDKEVMVLLKSGETINVEIKHGHKVKALSLLPLSDADVDLSGSRWQLENAKLSKLYPYAVSNEVQNSFTCTCRNGCIGVYLNFA